MVFPSFPVHMDPTDWQQVKNQENIAIENSFQPPPPPAPPCLQHPPPPPPSQQQHQYYGVGGGHADTGSGRGGSTMLGSIRPGSMLDRVRLARLPLPEAGLKCPRCESANTKFCYFNNYSLSQPRHFCKACRRYWTRGGALRNVPAGGGCRRNNNGKRTGKSPTIERRPTARGSRHIGSSTSSTTHHDRHLNPPGTSNTTSHLPFAPPPPTQVTFLPSLQRLGASHHHDFAPRDHIGRPLNLQGFPPPPSVTHTGGGGMDFFGSLLSQAQEFSFLSAGLEAPTTNGLYPSFDDEGSDQGNMILAGSDELIGELNYQTKGLDSGGIIMSQITSSSSSPILMKMEENDNSDLNQGLRINSSKNNILQLGQLDQLGGGINQVINGADHDGDQRYNWNGSCTWADLSRFTQSSSTSHLL